MRENRVPRIREIGSLQVHIGYLIFSLKRKLIIWNLLGLTLVSTPAVRSCCIHVTKEFLGSDYLIIRIHIHRFQSINEVKEVTF